MFAFLDPTNSSLLPGLPSSLVNRSQELSFQDVLVLLVLLSLLISLVVLPADSLPALSAEDVAYNVSASGHVALAGLTSHDIDDVAEKIRLAMLATEVLPGLSTAALKIDMHICSANAPC